MQDDLPKRPLAKAITPRANLPITYPIIPNCGRQTPLAIAFAKKQSPQKSDPDISPGRSTKTGLRTKRWLLSAVAYGQRSGRLNRLDHAIANHNRHLQLLHEVVANLDIGKTF